MATQPLDGVRVLDLSRGMPGVIASMLLADYGGDIIKAERRGGDAAWRRAARIWDRNKRSIEVDYDADDDRRLLRRLAIEADVVLHDWTPGRIDTVGLGAAELRAAAPHLVYCAISAYGQSGPWRDLPGYDATVAARLGVMAEWGGPREGPVFQGHPALGYSTGMVAAIGILAALRARIVTGEGDEIDTSMRDGMLAQMAMNWWSERNLSFIKSKSRTGGLDLGNQRLLLAMYECGDGELIQIHTGASGGFGRAMQALGLEGEITPAADSSAEGATLLTDDDVAIVRTRIPDVFKTRSREEWLTRFWEFDVAALPVQRPGEVLDDNHVRFVGLVQEIDDPELGRIEVVGPAVKLEPSRTLGIRWPAPTLDQHGAAIRKEGWSSAGLPVTETPKPLEYPLSGIRIAEFSNWFAGPYGNRMLGDLGADVIKVEPLFGDPQRPLPNPFEGAHRGKRDLSIDLKSPLASEPLRRLLASVDVVQHNMRPGGAERVGLDYDAVRSLNPTVVYGYSPGFGSFGPKSGLQSFAPLLSGFAGVTFIAAGVANPPQISFGSEDYYNGLLTAFSILLGLIHRERTGDSFYVESPQVHSIVFATSEWYKQDGQYRSTLPVLDHEQTGWSPGYRIYQCLDGWICVACTDDTRLRKLVDAVLPADVAAELKLPTDDADRLSEVLQDRFFTHSVTEWFERLTEAGVPCEIARENSWFEDFLRDDAMMEEGLVRDDIHPLHGHIRTIGEIFHLTRHPARIKCRSPLLGEHTRDILCELGYDDGEITDLESQRVVRVYP